MSDYRIELELDNGKRFANIDIYPLINSGKVFIYNADCDKYTEFKVDLSGENGNVASYVTNYEGYRYQLPKAVKEVIKAELN